MRCGRGRRIGLVAGAAILLGVGVLASRHSWEAGASAARPQARAERRTAAAPVRPTGPVAPGVAVPEGRVRIVLRPAGSAAPAAAAPAAAGRPPYPWAVPAPALETLRRLRAGKLDIDATDESVTQVVAKACRDLGVEVRFSKPELAELRLTLRVQQLEFEHSLNLICRMHSLGAQVGADGVVTICPEADLGEEPTAVRAWRALADVRQGEPGDERLPAGLDEVMQGLHSGSIDLDFTQASFYDVVEAVSQLGKVNVEVDRAVKEGEAPVVSVHVSGRLVDEALREVAERAGLGLSVDNGIILFTTREEAARRNQEAAERRARITEILARPIAFEGRTVEGYRLVEALKAQAGVEVLADETVWNREQPLAVAAGARPLGEVLKALGAEAGLHWRLKNGVLYLH